MFLAALPGAYQTQLLARLFDDTVVAHPGPRPPTAGGRALVRHVGPPGGQEIRSPVRQLPHPLLLGQGTQDPAGHVRVPATPPGQLVGGPAPTHRRAHPPADLPQQRPQGRQPPRDRDDQGLRPPPVDQGLFQGLQVAWRAGLLALEVVTGLLAAPLLGLRRSPLPRLWPSRLVSTAMGPGFSSRVWFHRVSSVEENRTHFLCGFQYVHEP
jgi:hypothetical protein